MAATGYRNIIVQWPNQSGPRFSEALAAEAITPGQVLEWASETTVQKSNADGGTVAAQKIFAVESPVAPGTAVAIDHPYASGDTVRFVRPPQGAYLYAWLADSNDVDRGDPLGPDGDGGLELLTLSGTVTVPGAIVAYAAEDLNNTSGAPSRILVEVA